MPHPPLPAPLHSLPADALLGDLLAVSLTGLIYYTPIYDPAGSGDIVDFRFEYLNPAAQRMMNMPERPTLTYNEQWPHSKQHGTFDFHVDAYLSGEPREYNINYQADGYNNYYRLAARRSGDGLWVSFTDTADQPRSPIEEALRETQAALQTAHRTAEAQRQYWQQVLEQAPAAIAVLEGPDYRINLANPLVCEIWARTPSQVLNKPLFEALPEVRGQGLEPLLEGVLHTGQPYVGTELPVELLRHGRRETVYFNFVYQPQRDAAGAITGVLVVATDVTDMVLSRQRTEVQEHETAQLNEELQATNEELLKANADLQATQHALQQLNRELEARVQERTRLAREQGQRLERLFMQAPAAVCILAGPELVYELVNPAYQQFFPGRPLLGRPLLEALPELADHAAYHTMRQVFDTGQPLWQQALRTPLARTAGGELEDRYFNYVQQPRFDAHGRVDGVMVLGFEVTELVQARRQAETLQADLLAAAQRQLQEREALYHILADTPAAVALLRGPEHRFEYVNAAYQQLFPERQLVGRPVAEALPETVEFGFVDLLNEVYETGNTFYGTELPLSVAQPDGQPARDLFFTFTYQRYEENGRVAGVSIFAFDVTDQVQARKQREAERQQLHTLFMEAPAPIVILDGPRQVFQLVNPAYQRVFPGRALLGKSVLEALPELAGTPAEAALRDVYETGRPFVAQEMPLRMARHEGGPLEELYFTFTYQPRRTSEGVINGIMMFGHEVTDQVQARRVVEESSQRARALAQKLSMANEQLQRTNVDLDNFIYTASHDLKAPISNIEGLLYLLQDELPAGAKTSGHVAPTLTRMLESVERFKRTIEHLTDVTKLQKEYDAPVTSVSLKAVIEGVRQDLLPLIQAGSAQVFVDVKDHPVVRFAEKNLRSVVYNLLSNALKYHAPDRPPRVDLRVREQPGHLVLEVHDNGLGIEPAHQARLFNMFQRFHTHVEGSGIGLYMVKRIVENAGGRIHVQSQLGTGTTFFVHLPTELEPGA